MATIGYCVPVNPRLASFRLRVAIPSAHIGMAHTIGGLGDVNFFFKNGNPTLARGLERVVYDVVNAHFDDPDYRSMLDIAGAVTCSSAAMAATIKGMGRDDAVVIADPYENEEKSARVAGDSILWFGHQANINSLRPYSDLEVTLCTGSNWSFDNEARALAAAGVVLLTGSNPGASSNRPAKAIRAGRFVVAPEDCPESWRELAPYMWIGDVRRGVNWAFGNREEASWKVQLGQKKVRETFSPRLIGSQWAGLFASILGAATSRTPAGSA